MAEIIPLRNCECRAAIPVPASPFDGLRRWWAGLLRRRHRLGRAEDLPERLQRDLGLAPAADDPPRHYADYLSGRRP